MSASKGATMDAAEGSVLVEWLSQVFPTLPPGVVEQVVEATGGEYDAAFGVLSDMVAEAHDARDPVEEEHQTLRRLQEEEERLEAERVRRQNANRERRGEVFNVSELAEALPERNRWTTSSVTFAERERIQRLKAKYRWADDATIEELLKAVDGDSEKLEMQLIAMYPVDDYAATVPEPQRSTPSGADTTSPVTTASDSPPSTASSASPAVAVLPLTSSRDFVRAQEQFHSSLEAYESARALAQMTKSATSRQEAADKLRKYEDARDHLLAVAQRDKHFCESRRLDLHGYSVRDAMALVEAKLEVEERAKRMYAQRRQFEIITGKGSSTKGRAKIRAAVDKYLQENQYSYRLEHHGGAFSVLL